MQPNCADDVSIAIKVLTKGANEDGSTCKFAVKSGGHTPWAGANDIDGGISIDLDYINSTILSGDSQYISLGTGSTWLNVYNSLNGTGLATAGARCALAGVGGVTLGGGISFFAPRVGFTSDNVISYEVVIASGEIIYANSTSHSDLFKALKGGSGNFGIVTRFDVSTFENGNGELWGGVIVNPATSEVSRSTRVQIQGWKKVWWLGGYTAKERRTASTGGRPDNTTRLADLCPSPHRPALNYLRLHTT